MVIVPYKLYCTLLLMLTCLEWAIIKLSVGIALFLLCYFQQPSKYNFKQTQQSVLLTYWKQGPLENKQFLCFYEMNKSFIR